MTTKKTVTLRAFSIHLSELSQNEELLKRLLIQKLENSKTGDRRMKLHPEEPDEDVLASFNISSPYVFGMMLRITNGISGQIKPELFEKESINIADVASEVDSNLSLYKDHYYFLMSNDKIIVSLPSDSTIKGLQTYLNWLLEPDRGECMFELQPMISKSIPTTKLNEIKAIRIGSATQTQSTSATQTLSFTNITKSILEKLIQDTDTVQEILENNLVQAELRIHFKKKDKDVSREDRERILGSTLAPVADLDGIRFETSKGTFISGEEIQCKERVHITKTPKGYMMEPELKLEMEKFLSKL